VTNQKTKVLVVDDDPNLTDLLVDTLVAIGYEAFAAESAKSALEVLRKEQIDLVISDINMPDMSGIELLEEIKKANHQLPVMLITGIGSNSIKNRAYSSGADGFLAKPFRIGTIESEISRMLTGIKKTRVVIIDDNRDFLSSLTERLEGADNIVYPFTAVAEAAKFLESHTVDLVITDLKMPDGDGISLFNDLHKLYPDLPVIMVSAYATDDILEKIKETGISKFLPKPLNFKEIETVVAGCKSRSS
jgi:putative two-component system response regulator